jgi:hypothetical protein
MKKTLLICIGLLTLSAATASAQIQARWNNCALDGGAANVNNACTSNFGTNRLAVSYTMPQAFAGFVAIDGQIDLQADSGNMPAWWDLKNAGACRSTAASISIDGTVLPGYSGACADTWDFGATGIGLFTGYALGYGADPTRARAVFAIARPFSNPVDLANGANYLGWIWQIGNANTTTCAGCLDPVAIVVTQIVLSSVNPGGNQASAQTVTLKPDANNVQDACGGWNGGVSCLATPTRSTTWGNVKALYR